MAATSSIFKGAFAKLLASAGLEFKDGTQIQTGTVVPTVTATLGSVGSLYINTPTSTIYQKQDAGTTTNWNQLNENLGKYITQTGHGFTLSKWFAVYWATSNTLGLAKADVAGTSNVVGIAYTVDANTLLLISGGLISHANLATINADGPGTALSANTTYYLSAVTAGLVSATAPSTVGQISQPVLIGKSAAAANVASLKTGQVVGGANVPTSIGLTLAGTTVIQNVSNYPNGGGGKINGTIFVAGSTAQGCRVEISFSKISSTSYNITAGFPASSIAGAVTASINETNGNISITLPTISGATSASIIFSIDAASVGVTLPLQIDSNLITWREPTSFRNVIINGAFLIWQRGTTQATGSPGYGSDDQWQNTNTGSTRTSSQQSVTVGDATIGQFQFYSRTVVVTSAGASNEVRKRHPIEFVRTLAGQTVTLSFWAKADANKNIATEFTQQFGTGGSPSTAVTAIGVTTFALTTSWQRFSVSVTLPSISGKTLGTNNNDYLELIFWFDAGSSFNARTNSLGQQSGTFDIVGVQLEAGSVASPFELRPVATELALCQRYCFKDVGTVANTIARTINTISTISETDFIIPLPVPMRASPTVSMVGTRATDWVIKSVDGTTNSLAATFMSDGRNVTAPAFYFSAGTFVASTRYYILFVTTSGGILAEAVL